MNLSALTRLQSPLDRSFLVVKSRYVFSHVPTRRGLFHLKATAQHLLQATQLIPTSEA